MPITLRIRPLRIRQLDRKTRTSVYKVALKNQRGKLRNGEKVCLGKPLEKDGRFNYAVYKVNDANAVVANLGNITTDRRDLSGEENNSQKLNDLDESVWNELDKETESSEKKESDEKESRNESRNESERDESDEEPEKEDSEKEEPDDLEESEEPSAASSKESEDREPSESREPTVSSEPTASPSSEELFRSTVGGTKSAKRVLKKTKKIIPLHM